MTGILYLARHGETNWNAQARIQGQQDTMLSEHGFRQRKALFQLLKKQPITRIYTSALQRTILTATPLHESRGCPLLSTPMLNELSFGVMEGLSVREPGKAEQELWDWWREDPMERGFPGGGESHRQLRDRIDTFLSMFKAPHEGEAVLIIGHMCSNQMLLHRLLDLDLSTTFRLHHPNTLVYRLSLGDQTAVHHIQLQLNGASAAWEEGILIARPDQKGS